jgi:uncharacterized protein
VTARGAVRRLFPVLSAALTVAVSVGVAGAHVEISPEAAPKGATIEVTFSPENEQVDAGTTKVEIQFPRKHPIVTAEPVDDPLWESSVKLRKVKKAVRGPNGKTKKVVDVLTFEGGPSPTEGHFDLSAVIGPLPTDVDELYFKVRQTYENGHVDYWFAIPSRADPEPSNEAPVLRLVDAQ